MPKGPQGQKRPADVIGAAIRVARIATGEEAEDGAEPVKQSAGKKGGVSRAQRLTPEQRTEAAKLAAQARWRRNKPS
jgi:hypothetical protein